MAPELDQIILIRYLRTLFADFLSKFQIEYGQTTKVEQVDADDSLIWFDSKQNLNDRAYTTIEFAMYGQIQFNSD
jgi:hypothetical protein